MLPPPRQRLRTGRRRVPQPTPHPAELDTRLTASEQAVVRLERMLGAHPHGTPCDHATQHWAHQESRYGRYADPFEVLRTHSLEGA